MATTEEQASPGRWIEYVPLDQLHPDPRNPKDHDAALMDDSLDRFGYVELIEVDERTGMVVAGHGRRERFLDRFAAGAEPPDGVRVADDGRWLVPVVRGWASRDDDEAFAYLVASNAIGPKGGWQVDLLAEGLQHLAALDGGIGLVGIGYTNDDLVAMLAELAPPAEPEMRTDPDDVPEAPADPITKPGDLWLLGAFVVCPHCGTHNDVSDS